MRKLVFSIAHWNDDISERVSKPFIKKSNAYSRLYFETKASHTTFADLGDMKIIETIQCTSNHMFVYSLFFPYVWLIETKY